MADIEVHRPEILDLLRDADCHYGNTLRDEEAGLSVPEAAAKRDGVKPSRIIELRRAVHQVAGGEHSRVTKWAEHEDAVLRALLHFDATMTPELRRYLYARLAAVQSEFGLPTTTEKLACRTRGAQARRTRVAAPSVEQLTAPEASPEPDPATDHSGAIDTDPASEVSTAVDEAGELGYANAEDNQLVDALAMERALEEAKRRWPTATVERMPHNNPGYDIEVRHPAGDIHFVEVEGSRSPDPCFFITAGEVTYSRAHPDRYSLWIFHAMDLETGTATLTAHDGPVTETHFDLRPVQYRGRFTGAG
ncbi:protein NO VEIN domain-containing protein [Mycolicibacter virginiensis]|uniref:protein NO VEIN domain-containing protein n=1 Tax=Mycolicibacter virginiensis TaxID=1795032 RepID=UPI001F0496BA|nr:DUF3883 domain-containing protein [Mycolicibacter virginiensis]ULP48349.1 DUF3883 domain-containing protein [Mycolicibacter virginiensis]